MLNITSHQRDANSNHNEIPLHTTQNGHCNQINKQQVLVRMWRKGNPSALLVGMQVDAATVESSVQLLQKVKNHWFILECAVTRYLTHSLGVLTL